MKKKLISLLLVLALAVGICPAAFAVKESPVDDEVVYSRAWRMPDTVTASGGEEDSILRYGERPVTTVLSSTKVTKITKPEGQNPGGISFPDCGGSLFIDATKGPSISFDVSVSWQVSPKVSISANMGSIVNSNPGGVGGVIANIPAGNDHYIVKIRQTFIVERVRVDISV